MRGTHRSRGRRIRQAVALLALFALVAAACGDDDEPTAAPATTQAPEAAPEVAEPEGEPAAPEPEEAPAAAPAADEPCVRVAFMMVRDIHDSGWNEAHGNGAAYLAEQMPCAEVTVLTDVIDDQTSEGVMRDLAEDGNDLIFATSFGYLEFMSRVAPEYPDVVFEHATGYLTDANFSNYSGSLYEATYLAGLVAGSMTETNKLGYVGPFTTPDVLRDFNAWVVGAREVNPDVEVQMIWVNTWFDPAQETQAAQTLLDNGADVLFYGTSGGAVGQAADAAGALWVAGNALVRGFAPESFLTGPSYVWGVYYVEAAQAVRDGNWDNIPYWGSMADGFIDLADFGPAVPDDVAEMVNARRAEIEAGNFDVFVGPIVDHEGNLQVPDGEPASLEHIWGVDYVLDGIEGTLPN